MEQLVAFFHWLWHPDLILAVQRRFGPGWRTAFEGLSLLGGQQIAIAAVVLSRWASNRRLACRLLLTLALGIAVDLAIWNAFPTPRPDDARIRIASVIPISSFPSGHLVTVVTLWGTLAAERLLPWVVPCAIALLVALARLGLGEHYPGDVAGGIVVGAILLAVGSRLWRLLRTAAPGWPLAGRAAACGALAAAAAGAIAFTPPGRWALLALAAAAPAAILAEVHWIGDDPDRLPLGRRARRLLLGLLGLAPLAGVAALAHGHPVVTELLVPAAAVAWAFTGAPAAFRRLGLSAPSPAAPGAETP